MTYGAIEGGYDTARPVPSADRVTLRHYSGEAVQTTPQARAAYVREWLLFPGHVPDGPELAEILGLVPAPRRSRRAATASPARPPRPCPMCGKDFTPTHSKQETCGKSCGARKAYRTRVAQEAGS
jgi:hypothetical protein